MEEIPETLNEALITTKVLNIVKREFVNMIATISRHVTIIPIKEDIFERAINAKYSNNIFRLIIMFPANNPMLTIYGPDLPKLTKIYKLIEILPIEDGNCLNMAKYENNKLFLKKLNLDKRNIVALFYQACLEISTHKRHIARTLLAIYSDILIDYDDYILAKNLNIINGSFKYIELLHIADSILLQKLEAHLDYHTIIEIRKTHKVLFSKFNFSK